MTAIVFVFSVCSGLGQEITKGSEITIEYWHAFKGISTHTIKLRDDGTYTAGTMSRDSEQKIETWKPAEKSLTTEYLEPLLAFCNTPEVRRAFAETERQSILDGDALTVKFSQNKYSLQFYTQPCLDDTNTAAERKLVAIVTEILRRVDLRLYEPPNWQDVLVSREDIDTVGLSKLFTALRRLYDTKGRTIPLKLYLLGKPDEKKQIKIPVGHRRVKDILHDVGTSLGLGFRTFREIAVYGTPEELHRFETAMAGQPPLPATSAGNSIPSVEMISARLDELTDFVNRKLDAQNSAWRLECLSHADHRVFFAGNDILVAEIISVIAADLGEPVSKIFAETKQSVKAP